MIVAPRDTSDKLRLEAYSNKSSFCSVSFDSDN